MKTVKLIVSYKINNIKHQKPLKFLKMWLINFEILKAYAKLFTFLPVSKLGCGFGKSQASSVVYNTLQIFGRVPNINCETRLRIDWSGGSTNTKFIVGAAGRAKKRNSLSSQT